MAKDKQLLTPPDHHLTERSQALWVHLIRTRIRTPERQTLLRIALEDLDRVDALREVLAAEGVTVISKRSGVPRSHPALRAEAEARSRFFKMWRALALDQEPSIFDG